MQSFLGSADEVIKGNGSSYWLFRYIAFTEAHLFLSNTTIIYNTPVFWFKHIYTMIMDIARGKKKENILYSEGRENADIYRVESMGV